MSATEFDLSQAIGLTDAAKLMHGRGGKHPSIESVRRWGNPRRGCFPAGKDGPRLLLETRRINGEILTMAAWVAEFEQARARMGVRPVDTRPAPRSSKQRERAYRKAEASLEAKGVK